MKLYPFQEEVLKKTNGLRRVGYFLDMGLGKTFVGTEKAKRVGNTVNLIVCQKSKVKDWIDHVREQYDISVFDLTNKKDYELFFPWKKSRVGVINYDLIFRRPELLGLENFTIILDESTCVQNPKAKRTKAVMKMQPDAVILLSGSVSGGKYENLYTHCRLLGWRITKKAYDERYVNWRPLELENGIVIQIPDKKDPYKNVDELKANLRKHGAVFMKTDEVIDLPEQNFMDVRVPRSSMYKRFEKDRYLQLEDTELIGDTSLTKLLYLRQLAGMYSKDKLNAFKDLLESTDDRLIVFYNFNHELRELKKATDRPISEVNGHRKDLTNYENESDSVTFIQYQAGSMGLNLQKANKIVYFSPPLSSEHYEQSKKRIHRIGQSKPCFYYKLIMEGSVEENIYQTLAKRMDFTDELFREVSHERLASV